MLKRTYWKTVGHFFPFKMKEVQAILLSTVILGFIFSFSEWGYEKFNILIGLKNLILSMIIAFIALISHQIGSRLFGIKRGYRVEFRLWFYGLLFGLIAVFVSNGRFWFIAPGGIILHHLAGHRIGYFRYGLNALDLSMISYFGILGNLVMAFICKWILYAFPTSGFLAKLMMVNIWMAIWSLAPLPPLDGANIIFGSRLEYVFFAVVTIAVAILLMRFGVLLSVLLSVLLAAAVWVAYWWWASGEKVGLE